MILLSRWRTSPLGHMLTRCFPDSLLLLMLSSTTANRRSSLLAASSVLLLTWLRPTCLCLFLVIASFILKPLPSIWAPMLACRSTTNLFMLSARRRFITLLLDGITFLSPLLADAALRSAWGSLRLHTLFKLFLFQDRLRTIYRDSSLRSFGVVRKLLSTPALSLSRTFLVVALLQTFNERWISAISTGLLNFSPLQTSLGYCFSNLF